MAGYGYQNVLFIACADAIMVIFLIRDMICDEWELGIANLRLESQLKPFGGE